MTRPILRSIAVVIALSLGCVGAAAAQASPPPPGETPSLPDIVAPLLGAVVNISVLKPANAAAEGTGASAQIGRTQHRLGSGFIIDPAGYIATNRHVVADGYTVTVTLDDDRQFPAKVLATNLYPDLALLKIEARAPLPTVGLATATRSGSARRSSPSATRSASAAGSASSIDNIGIFDRSPSADRQRTSGTGRRDRVDGLLLRYHALDGA